MSGQRGGIYGWLDRRYDLAPLVTFLRHKEVPLGVHSALWYYLGGMTLFFFCVQIVTGVLLLAYYQPGETTSYETIRIIATKVPFGWLFRAAHAWSAHFMILSLLAHMVSTFLLKAYRHPRELTWLTGFFLLCIVMGFGFSGYLLPWNQLAYFATAVGTDVVKSVPLVGDWVLQVMRGGRDVTIATLYRFFALHVVILPLAAFVLIGTHVLFVQRQGMAAPVGMVKAPRGMRFFPNFAVRDLLLWLFALTLLVTVAVLWPYGPGIPGVEWELGLKADPTAPAYPGIKPEWYFLWVYQLLKEFPPHLLGMEGPQAALVLVTGLVAVCAAVPWLDRRAARNQPSPAFSDVGIAALTWLAFLSLKAWDVGAGGASEGTPGFDAARVAWHSAWWTLGPAALIAAWRFARDRHSVLVFSGAAALHAALHGLLGLAYLRAGAVALVGVALALTAQALLRRFRGAKVAS